MNYLDFLNYIIKNNCLVLVKEYSFFFLDLEIICEKNLTACPALCI